MEYTLKFTEQQMHVLNMAIGELPHKFAAPLILSINEQIVEANALGQPHSESETPANTQPHSG